MSEKREDVPAAGGPQKKRKKQNKFLFDIISGTVLIAAVCVFVFSLYQLVMMLVPVLHRRERVR